MAYTFLLEEDNTLIASRREVIMQRSKLVDDVWFLVNPEYKLEDMSVFNVMLEFILPTSREYHTLELTQDPEGYNGYLKFVVPFDCNLSSESGDVQLQLTFTFVGLDADGNVVQKVRKTKVGTLHVTSIANWANFIPDAALSSLDQRILKTQAQIQELGYYASVLNENQVDNLKYDDKAETLQLMAGGKTVGDTVNVRDMIDEGIPVIDFENTTGGGSDSDTDHEDGCGCGCEDNVVIFSPSEGGSETDEPIKDDSNVVEFY